MIEAAYTIARLVQEFQSIESKDSEPWIEGLSLALMSKNVAKVKMTLDVHYVRNTRCDLQN